MTPFFTALTPDNIATRFHNGISVAFSLNSSGDIVSSRLSLAKDAFTSLDQLLNLPSKPENRVFDAFYYMLLSEHQHSEYLSLKPSEDMYDLLRKSGTYKLPDWVQISDDYALAQDWNDSLKYCGIKGANLRGILSALSGILLMGNSSSADISEGASLIGIAPEIRQRYKKEEIISSVYKLLVHKLVGLLNDYLSTFDVDDQDTPENEIVSVVNIVECSPSAKYSTLANVFDNSVGINAELFNDGIVLPKTPKSLSNAIKKLEQSTSANDSSDTNQFKSFLDPSLCYLASTEIPRSTDGADEEVPGIFDLRSLMSTSRVWTILNISSFNNARELSKDQWSGPVVSSQIREYYIKDWVEKRRGIDFTADFEHYEFLSRYSALLPQNIDVFMLEEWARNERNWGPADFSFGRSRLWLSENAWNELETGIGNPVEQGNHQPEIPFVEDYPMTPQNPFEVASFAPSQNVGRGSSSPVKEHNEQYSDSRAMHGNNQDAYAYGNYKNPFADVAQQQEPLLLDNELDEDEDDDDVLEEDYFLKKFDGDVENDPTAMKEVKVERVPLDRRMWVGFVWLMTFWIPSPILKWFGGMKRADVRMAWREKLTIVFLIFLINAFIIFYMIVLGKLICPDYDKVWNAKQVSTHQGTDDYYVSIHGRVYDMTKFYKLQHSDNGVKTTSSLMMEFAGQDLSDYFPPPLTVACPGLVSSTDVELTYNTTTSTMGSVAMHSSGSYFQPSTTTKLHNYTWYNEVLQPALKKYYKGKVVSTRKSLLNALNNEAKYVFTINNQIFDVTNYFLTTSDHPESGSETNDYNFFSSAISDMFQQAQGTDITDQFYSDSIDATTRARTLNCLNNAFYAGEIDFRNSAKCQTANIILLVIAGLLTFVTVVKFLSSLRFGSRPRPSLQDKFVICQIPAYTESEDELRLAIDSLTNLDYDNRRKLLMVICDGMIVGSGNDRPTPRIVLDLFGVDDKIDPPALPYHSVGEESNQVNFAKVYSGLYENDGNVVPFVVVAKCGRPDERERPGNRGKRDSQILMLEFLNCVHYQKPMSPLHLELFHHINNIIGVDPELYEYLFMVDADTSVREDSLNRLVAECVHDNKIAGTCGETGLQNEEQSWSTMVQVYEYFISHHLTKAFESIFGSVTCLPGCFSLYRLRTAKKFKPLIMSNDIIREYSVNNVDTLHKKNLFSLGEDRYLTTLMSKHFPKMKYTFVADAYCATVVPDQFSVLLSQRRRWINSTVHNLVELLRLQNMCGFCCFGMRGVVFVDLVGTLMLPSVVVYLVYLIYVIASHTGPLPLISIVLIAAVYGLQMLVFILRRQWQHIGWMIIYIAAYPIHSFLLPIYSFWNMDNFTWGNTRIVLEEKGSKQAVAVEPLKIDPASIEMETWKSYASRNGLPGTERRIVYDDRKGKLQFEVNDYGYDMQDLGHLKNSESMYSRPVSTYSELESTARPASQFRGAKSSRMSLAPTELVGTGEMDTATKTQIRDVIRGILQDIDLDTTTKRQLRSKVEDIMGLEFFGDKIKTVDSMIDEELENLDFDDDDDENNQSGGDKNGTENEKQ